MALTLGIDIGGTNVRLGLVTKVCELSGFTQLKTESVFTSDSPIADLAIVIENYLDDCGKKEEVISVAIGFPSTVDKDAKVVLSTPNIPMLQNVPVVDDLSKRLKLPIFINRDVNFLMLFDIHYQKLNTAGVLLGFYFGTGIGNALFIDGKSLRGKNGVTAELGHIPMIHDDSLCSCGNVGCLENHASGKYLVSLIDSDFPGIDVSDIFSLHANHPKILTFIENTAIAVAIEVNLLDPEFIVLGGGVLQMKDFPKSLLEERIKARARKPFPSENLEIIYATDGQENGVIGAGIYAFEQLR